MTTEEYKSMAAAPKKGRYGRNKRTETPDGLFDSAGEARRWAFLKIMQQQDEIGELQRQVSFPFEYKGVLICTYKADFTYESTDKLVVEDWKGNIRTPEFRIKEKLMAAFYDITIKIVTKHNADVRPV